MKELLIGVGLVPVEEMSNLGSQEKLCAICRKIRMAPFAIVDISGRPGLDHYCARASVCYELGLLHALGRKVGVFADSTLDVSAVPYDFRPFKIHRYKQYPGGITLELERKLCEWINQNVPRADTKALQDRLSEINAKLAALSGGDAV